MPFGKRITAGSALSGLAGLQSRNLLVPVFAGIAVSVAAAVNTASQFSGDRGPALRFAPQPKIDLAKRLAATTRPQPTETGKSLDAKGRLQSEVQTLPDGSKKTVTYEYNTKGGVRRTITENPDGTESYTYYFKDAR